MSDKPEVQKWMRKRSESVMEWTPQVEVFRAEMMRRFSNKLSMEEIVGFCYFAAHAPQRSEAQPDELKAAHDELSLIEEIARIERRIAGTNVYPRELLDRRDRLYAKVSAIRAIRYSGEAPQPKGERK